MYRATLFYIILAMETRAGGGDQFSASLYQPCISHHTYFMRVRLYGRRYLTTNLASSALRFLSPLSRTLMYRPNILVIYWFCIGALRRATLSPMAIQVHSDIQGALRLFVLCVLGMDILSSSNITSSRVVILRGGVWIHVRCLR